MTTITTPLGLLERGEYLRVTSWESANSRVWVHILRWIGSGPGMPEFVIVSRGCESPRVTQLGNGWGDYASDVDVLRHVFKKLGCEGPVHDWTIHEGGE